MISDWNTHFLYSYIILLVEPVLAETGKYSEYEFIAHSIQYGHLRFSLIFCFSQIVSLKVRLIGDRRYSTDEFEPNNLLVQIRY
jgi:hypothetical protein